MRIERILVPVTGGESDKIALQLACDIARQYRAKVYAIHVIEVKRTLPIDAEKNSELDKGEEIVDEAEQFGRRANVSIESELLQAREVGPAIVDEAVERSVDTVIMGLPYKRKFGEFSLGATASYLLKNAPCQVWVCRESTV